jgi:hypothetical protein
MEQFYEIFITIAQIGASIYAIWLIIDYDKTKEQVKELGQKVEELEKRLS